MSFTILTDSCCDLPKSLIDTYSNFHMVHLTFMMDGEPGDPTMTEKGFYQRLRDGSMSSTSQVNPEAFLEAYEKIYSEGNNEIFYLGFSSGLSGTYNSGVTAKKIFQEKNPSIKIITVDSLSASMGYGFLVDCTVRLREEGKTIEETRDWLEANKLKVNHWYTVDDLNFLQRGGRISAGAAWFGTAMSIKPVMNMNNEGRLIPIEKRMGRKKAIRRLVEKMEEMAVNPAEQTVFISHGDCMDDVVYLQDLLKEKLGVQKFQVSYVGTVIGSHTGPGVLAFYFMGDHR